MRERWHSVAVAIALMSLLGCADASRGARSSALPSTSPMTLEQLDQHLAQLTTQIDGITARLEALRHTPEAADPVIRELRALDLKGWELHRAQWLAQRDHLQIARNNLQRVQTNPEERAELLGQWARHQHVFMSTMDEFRRERLTVERKRLEVESALIERALRGQ